MQDMTLADFDTRIHTNRHATNSPFFLETALVPGLPEGLQVVPSDPVKWRMWARSVRAHRELRHRQCAVDIRQQEVERELCRRDPAYFLIMWGCIFEARSVEGEPPSWKSFVLFHFQVQMIRFLQHMMKQTEKGRGDGIWEKSRDMGATNVVCGFAVHQFLFEQVFVCAFISRNYDAVYKRNSTDTIFYKIQALLGVEDAVPPHLKLPRFLQPRGFDKEIHIAPGAIKNPEPGRTCFLVGETTTKLSGVSGRSTLRVNDEAARFDAFHDTWANQQATSDHRLALSTADLRSKAFYNLARLGEQCLSDPQRPGPSYMRLNWWLHPFHTQEWYKNQRDRALAEGDPHKFAREYDIDYFAGEGDHVYPRFRGLVTEHCPYDPMGGQVYCWIDNGIRDPAGIVFAQVARVPGELNILTSFEGYGGEDVTFYASVLTGVYLSGEHQYNYDMYPGVHQFMEFTGSIRQPIIYIGDPAGDQRGAGGEEDATWFRQLNRKAMEIAGKTVHVHMVSGQEPRTHEFRKNAVNDFIPRLHFDHNAGASRVLYCMQNSKYPRPQRVETREPLKPLHDDMSHIRTAVEWGLTYLKIQQDRVQQGPVVAQRVTMAGQRANGNRGRTSDRSFW